MSRVIEAFAQFLDGEGDPLALGWLKFLESGSNNTLKNTYADSVLTVPNENPLQLDGEGRCPNVYGTGNYRVISYTYDPLDEGNPGTQIQQFDPVSVPATAGGGGGSGLLVWDAATPYGLGDVVTYSGAIYRSIIAVNLNQNPVIETAAWEELEFIQIWNVNVTYGIGDLVHYESGLYFSITSPNLGNTPDESLNNWNRIDTDLISVETKTADYEVLPVDRNILLIQSGATVAQRTFSLPVMDATMDGFVISVYNASATYDLVIDTLDSATVGLTASISIVNGQLLRLRYNHDGTVWMFESGYGPLLGGQHLGSAATPLDVSYIATDAHLYFGNSQEAHVRYTSSGLIFRSDIGLYLGTTDVSGVYFGTNNVNRWYITSGGDLVPLTANTYSIGSATYELDNIYLGDDGTIFFGNAQDVEMYWDGSDFEIVPGVDEIGIFKLGTLANTWEEIYLNALTEIRFYTSGTIAWEIDTGGNLLPGAIGGRDIGSTSAEIGNIYLDDSMVIAFGLTQDAAIWFHSSADQFVIRNTASGGVFIDQMNAAGSIYFRTGSSPTSRWYINTTGHFLPATTDTYDIGSTTLQIGSLYMATAQSIWIGDDQEVQFAFGVGDDFYILPDSDSLYGLIIGAAAYSWDRILFYADDFEINGTTITCAYTYSQGTSGGRAMYVSTTGIYGYNSSTLATKTNVQTLDMGGLLYALRPVSFNPIGAPKETRFGFIAEEVDEICSDLTFNHEDGKLAGINYEDIIPLLVKVAQEQETRIDNLEAIVNP